MKLPYSFLTSHCLVGALPSPENSPEITSQCVGRKKPNRKKENKKMKWKEQLEEQEEEVKLTFIVVVRRCRSSPENEETPPEK